MARVKRGNLQFLKLLVKNAKGSATTAAVTPPNKSPLIFLKFNP